MDKEALRLYALTGKPMRVKLSGTTFPSTVAKVPRQRILDQLKALVKSEGGIEVHITPEPDNPFNKGDEIALRVDLIGAELEGPLRESLDGADVGYIPLKVHVTALFDEPCLRQHYNGSELNAVLRDLPLKGCITKITGSSKVIYGAVLEFWVSK